MSCCRKVARPRFWGLGYGHGDTCGDDHDDDARGTQVLDDERRASFESGIRASALRLRRRSQRGHGGRMLHCTPPKNCMVATFRDAGRQAPTCARAISSGGRSRH
jgi:hypothetical protein